MSPRWGTVGVVYLVHSNMDKQLRGQCKGVLSLKTVVGIRPQCRSNYLTTGLVQCSLHKQPHAHTASNTCTWVWPRAMLLHIMMTHPDSNNTHALCNRLSRLYPNGDARHLYSMLAKAMGEGRKTSTGYNRRVHIQADYEEQLRSMTQVRNVL